VRPPRGAGRAVSALLAIAIAAALGSLAFAPPSVEPTGDERDYLRQAHHLTTSGVVSSAPIDAPASPDAYREPGYAALLALVWSADGGSPLLPGDLSRATGLDAVRGVHALGVALLVVAAVGAAGATRAAGAGASGALAAASAVCLSPALRQAALTPGSEGVTAALLALAGWALVSSMGEGSGRATAAAAGLAAGLAVLGRGAAIAVPPLAALLLIGAPATRPRRERRIRALLFLAVAVAPPLLWSARNAAALGHFELGDRGGQVLWTRAELDRQIAREGWLPAALTWTPWLAAQDLARERWPEATFGRYEWTGEGNFFTRSLRATRAAGRESGDTLASDRGFGRRALAEFATRPGTHLVTSFVVGWRGLFAERSPAFLRPIDLRLPLGLVLAGVVVATIALGVRRRHPERLALATIPVALFLLHAGATEYLPRFSVPALPLVWAAAVTLALLPFARPGAPDGPT